MASEATAVPVNAAWLFTGTSKNPAFGPRGPEGTGSADCSAPSWHELFSRELPSQEGSRGAISAGSHLPCASGGSSNDATGKNREAGPRETPRFGAFRNLSLAVPPHGMGRRQRQCLGCSQGCGAAAQPEPSAAPGGASKAVGAALPAAPLLGWAARGCEPLPCPVADGLCGALPASQHPASSAGWPQLARSCWLSALMETQPRSFFSSHRVRGTTLDGTFSFCRIRRSQTALCQL